MKKHASRHLITAALPYANGPKHIGHLAGAYLPADIYSRFLRLCGEEVLFVCGSDEHGTAIPIQARKENTGPQDIIDKYHALLKSNFKDLGISFDVYDRTSAPHHHETASEFFTEMQKKNLLTEQVSEQYYDAEAGMFLADRYITGECPRCANPSAFGDQCEKCGSSLSPKDLKNPKSTLSGNTPVLRETSHWYLPLDRYENWLREWLLEGHKSDWKTNVYGQCKSWIDSGLQPRAITRDLDWGVKVPGAEGKVLYVWFDAPIGYISATKKWAADNGQDWNRWWKNEDTRLIHFIGKDNIVFHCIIFPVMLHAHGGFILPENVPANEFMNLEGDKMSTSRGWSIEMNEYLEAFPTAADELRYCLTSNMPETKDSEFSWKDFQQKNNSELVGILGNFINRVLVLCDKFYGAKVPQSSACSELEEVMRSHLNAASLAMNDFRFREALQEVMNLARHGNKLLTDTEPWKTIKTDPEKAAAALFDGVQIAASLSIALKPFLPFTAEKLASFLNINPAEFSWKDAGNPALLKPNHPLASSGLLFNKIEDEIIEIQLNRLKLKSQAAMPSSNEPTLPAFGNEINYDDFAKIDLRCGTIISAEKVKNADKLLLLQVDLGLEIRQIVSGIAAWFDPETLPGTRVSVVANLAPRKIRGHESKGMLLLAEKPEGRLVFVSPPPGTENGCVIR